MSWRRILPFLCLAGAICGQQTKHVGGEDFYGYLNVQPGKIRFPEATVGTLPAASASMGMIYIVRDAISAADCTLGGSTLDAHVSTCRSNGTSWLPIGGGGVGSGSSPGGNPGDLQYNQSGTLAGSNLNQGSDGTVNASKTLTQPAPPTALTGTSVTCDLATSPVCSVLLSANTTMQLPLHPHGGTLYTFLVAENSTGGWSISYPASFINPSQMDTTAFATTTFHCTYNQTITLFLCSGGSSTDIGMKLAGPERFAPTTPAAGQFVFWPDSVDHQPEAMQNASSQRYYMIPMTGIFAGSSPGTPTPGPNTLTPSMTTAPLRLKVACTPDLGSDNATSVLVNADLGPQTSECFIPTGATIQEIWVRADSANLSTSVMIGRDRGGVVTNLLTAAIAPASGGGLACANTAGGLGSDGHTTCSATLQNTTLLTGDWITFVSGTADGHAHHLVLALVVSL